LISQTLGTQARLSQRGKPYYVDTAWQGDDPPVAQVSITLAGQMKEESGDGGVL
jgi:hypothetical protein